MAFFLGHDFCGNHWHLRCKQKEKSIRSEDWWAINKHWTGLNIAHSIDRNPWQICNICVQQQIVGSLHRCIVEWFFSSSSMISKEPFDLTISFSVALFAFDYFSFNSYAFSGKQINKRMERMEKSMHIGNWEQRF